MENNRKTSGNHRRKKGSRNHGIAMYPTLAVRWIKKNKALSAALAVLLIVVAGTGVLVGWGMGRGKAQKDAGETQASAETIPEQTGEEQESTVSPLLENEYPEVNDLILKYHQALQSDDMDTLKTLLDYAEDKELLRMQENGSHIESYNNIVCYTKPGLDADSYVVYACYDVKFVGFDTLVPGLTPFYVSRNEEGRYYIRDWEHNPDEAAYANEVTAQEDVAALYDRIRNESAEILAGDEELSQYLSNYLNDMMVAVGEALNEKENSPESTEAPTESAAAQESESKSEPEASQPAQTPSQPASTSVNVPNSGEFTVSETVNVRKSANENAERIGVCYSGEKLEILMKQADGWTRVKFNGQTGYVKSDVLK